MAESISWSDFLSVDLVQNWSVEISLAYLVNFFWEQAPDFNPIEHAFHLLKTKLMAKRPTNKQLKSATGLAKHQKGRNPVFGDVHVFQP